MSRTGPVTKDSSTVALGLAQIRIGNSAANISNINAVLTSANSIGALGATKFMSQIDSWKLESGFPMLEDISIPIRETASMEITYKEISSYNLALSRGLDPGADTSATSVKGSAVSPSGSVSLDPIAVDDAGGAVDDVFTVVFTGAIAGKIYGKEAGLVHTFAAVDAVMTPDNSGNPYFSIPANFFTGTWAADDTYSFKTAPFVAGTSAYADNHSGEIKLGAMKAPAYMRMEADYTYPNGTNKMHIVFPRANITSSTELEMQQEDAATPPMTIESKRADADIAGGNAVWDDKPLGRIYFT